MSTNHSQDPQNVIACDPIWQQLREEAQAVLNKEPELSGFLHMAVMRHDRLEDAILCRLAQRLAHPALPAEHLIASFKEILQDAPDLAEQMRIDMVAVRERDPACDRYLDPLLYFKGYHAIQIHRLAHHLWQRGREDFALYLQSRSSEVFQTDIHPAVSIGKGLFIDHATGVVIGGTAVISDNVSILQNVTLGGTGKAGGKRHPTIHEGVLIGAGAIVLGNIEVGAYSRVAAGSVVVKPVPEKTTVAGVPAKVVGHAGKPNPSHSMDHMLEDKI